MNEIGFNGYIAIEMLVVKKSSQGLILSLMFHVHCRNIESHGNLIIDAILTSMKPKYSETR
jgi:hypothetical protein